MLVSTDSDGIVQFLSLDTDDERLVRKLESAGT